MFFFFNRKRFAEKLPDNSITVLFSGEKQRWTADQHYNFQVNKNFYYLTGIAKPNLILMFVKRDNNVTQTLFLERNTDLIIKWEGARIEAEEAKEISGIENTAFVDEFETIFNRLNHGHMFTYLCADLERRGFNDVGSLGARFIEKASKSYPQLDVENIYPMIADLRVYKQDFEIEAILKANEVTKQGLENVMRNLKAGIYEYEAEAHFDFIWKAQGLSGNSFHTIAASGKNATVLHYEDNNSLIQDGDLILFDLGVNYNEYASDISRTYPANGKFTERQKQLYQIVLDVQNATIEYLKPGITFADFHMFAKKELAKRCIKIGLINEEAEISKYYYHGIGHYIGLDVHDVGTHGDKMSRKIEPGMVLTVEPGLYIAEEGIGIRIEDDILITENGRKNLSEGIIKSVEEIETFMAGIKKTK